MSALGHEQTSRHVRVMSVIPLKADIHQRGLHVRFVPCRNWWQNCHSALKKAAGYQVRRDDWRGVQPGGRSGPIAHSRAIAGASRRQAGLLNQQP
jgi:hypothetical protein